MGSRRILVLAVTTGLALAWASSAFPTPTASRPAWDGCHWTSYLSESLGISMLVQDCKSPSSHYVFSTVGNRIEQHRPADDRTYNGPFVLELYSKPASQSIEKAIEQQFIAKLPAEARQSCRVVPDRHGKNSWPRYTIEPTGAYAKKIHAELQQYPRDFGCGDYGMGQSDAYFEYHPDESLTRFVYVDTGQDEPLFDEESIHFLPQGGDK